jgi:hypothetical protein
MLTWVLVLGVHNLVTQFVFGLVACWQRHATLQEHRKNESEE